MRDERGYLQTFAGRRGNVISVNNSPVGYIRTPGGPTIICDDSVRICLSSVDFGGFKTLE